MLTSPHQIYLVPTARNQNIRNSRLLNNSQTNTSLKLSEKRINNNSLTTNSKDNNHKLTDRNMLQTQLQLQNQQNWPQIQTIIRKIKALEHALKNQRQANNGLLERISKYEQKAEEEQQQKSRHAAKMENYSQLQRRVKQLENILFEKENSLAAKQKIIQDMQFSQIKKNAQSQQKIRRLSIENRDLIEKVKMAKNEVQRERNNFKQLKNGVALQIEELREQKSKELQERLQALQQQSKLQLYQQMDLLNRKLYLQEQQLQKKNIQFSLQERKKQQAINEVAQKKDQQIKVIKCLIRTLNDKIYKLQEELKSKRSKTPEVYSSRHRMSRSLILSTVHEQEITFDLSPDKV